MAQSAVLVPDEEVAEYAPVPLRESVLSGAFFGKQLAAAERVGSFAFLPSAEALAEWFGPGAALRLKADPDGCRAAIDRDIAAFIPGHSGIVGGTASQ